MQAPQESFVDVMLKKQATDTSRAAERLMGAQAKEAEAEAERREAEWVHANPEAARLRAEARAAREEEAARYYKELSYKGLATAVVVVVVFIGCMHMYPLP